MTPNEVFSLANLTVMPMWIVMILLPNWKITRFLIDFKIVPILLSLVYAVYIGMALAADGMMDFGSLSTVVALFTKENAVLAGWVHYLAFDLLVGMWILDQNRELGLHQLLIAPCLLLTFMFGPVGFLLFMTLRTIKKQKT